MSGYGPWEQAEEEAKEALYELLYFDGKAGALLAERGSFEMLSRKGESLLEQTRAGRRMVYEVRIVKVVREYDYGGYTVGERLPEE